MKSFTAAGSCAGRGSSGLVACASGVLAGSWSASGAGLASDFVVYVAQVPSPRRLRMFAEVGRRVLP
ncbi:hypothetical protein AB0C32_36835, partial [Streptosporangium sp. NPDC048865]